MSRLPIPGQDSGTWGNILNDYLLQAHNGDGTLKDNSVSAAAIQSGAISETQLNTTVQSKIDGATQLSVNGTPVTSYNLDTTPLTASDVGAYTTAQTDSAIAALASGGTLTNPRITTGIVDINGNPILDFSPRGSAANRLMISNVPSGQGPVLSVYGPSDANIPLVVETRGTGGINQWLESGSTAAFSVNGTATNIDRDIRTQGTGVVMANGVPVATTTDAQTLTNKTLTTPKVDTLLDTNGNPILDFAPRGSAANRIMIANVPSGQSPVLQVYGPSDANIGLSIETRGSGGINQWLESGSSATFSVNGTATNIDRDIRTQGTGVVMANGVPVATTTDAQTLTNKTLTSPKITSGNAPATSTSTGVAGQVEWDSGYVYICVATNTWKRAALSSW